MTFCLALQGSERSRIVATYSVPIELLVWCLTKVVIRVDGLDHSER